MTKTVAFPSAEIETLPGVAMGRLTSHDDARGSFTELFRDEWEFRRPPARWNLEELPAGRRVRLDDELIVVLEGSARLDVRGGSVWLYADDPRLVGVDAGAEVFLHAPDLSAFVARAGERAAADAGRPVVGATWPGLPAGVEVFDLPGDAGVHELFGPDWPLDVRPVQWNAVSSRAGVLRGVHCHPRHADLLCVPRGRMRLGLADLRGDGVGDVTCIDLEESRPRLVSIPPGVAHGFLFLEPSLHVYAVDHTWNLADEMGCRWDDPALGIPWDADVEVISPRDEALGSVADLRAGLAAASFD